MPTDPSLIRTLAATVRGDASAAVRLAQWPIAQVVQAADHEGVTALVAACLADARSDLRAALEAEETRRAVGDLVRERELRAVIAALGHAAIPAVVFKGAQLAYECYAQPHLRPRLDSDILIGDADREAAERVLVTLGYRQSPQLEADLVSYQRAWVKADGAPAAHVVDLHWRVTNPQAFAGVLETAEVLAAARPLPALGAAARGCSLIHALLVAVVHPAAHHRRHDRLIWDLDTARLVARVTPAEWSEFVRVAREREVNALCHQRLTRAVDLFGAAVPSSVMEALATGGSSRERVRLRRTAADARQISAALADVQALPRWSDRWRLIRQHVLPPRQYMRTVYAPDSQAPIAVLYATRLVRGAIRWLGRPD